MTGRGAVVGRLAPTPSGDLHLGNALAFAAAWLSARSAGGRVLLRIEDVDTGRARDRVADGQRRDLEWLGLSWDEEVEPQSRREYLPWLEALAGRTYRCACTRAELQTRPCPCRGAEETDGSVRFAVEPGPARFFDRRWGWRELELDPSRDPTLRRRDGVYAYNLAVVADDLLDGVTEVVRGADLLDSVPVQEQIWRALGATPPTWLHAPLVLGADGKKLSKSHGSTELHALRSAGWAPADVWSVVLPWLGLPPEETLEAAIGRFSPTAGTLGPVVVARDLTSR